MGLHKRSLPICPSKYHCSQWARVYLKYCLCSTRDGWSLSLGLVSVVSWGVAEVPQIITNYREKSMEGLSFTFLMTWIIGDIFNLVGCLLEPATLPTQYYMALLYTVTTSILASQTIYYGHIYPRLKGNRLSLSSKDHKHRQPETLTNKNQNDCDKKPISKSGEDQSIRYGAADEGCLPSSPIPVSSPVLPHYGSLGRDFYYRSARSLSRSHTPTARSYLERTPSVVIQDGRSMREPLLSGIVSPQSAPHSNAKNLLSVVSMPIFFLAIFGLHLSLHRSASASSIKLARGVVIPTGRKLLQNGGGPSVGGGGSSGIGTYLGWAMAAIYMGGRLPQICLNIRRGHVEGLNPLMFIFALVGNTTYVASILVSSLDWSKLRPNLPWLVDAGGCVLLDCFIIIQFIYFHFLKSNNTESNRD